MTKRKQTKFQTAHWKGIVRPQFSPPGELTALSIYLPKELADDVALATYQDRSRFSSEEEFIATAILYVIKSIAEYPYFSVNPALGSDDYEPTL